MSAILYKDNPYGGTTSVMDASHILVEQGSETVTAQSKFNTYTTTIQRILGNFATVEESAIASKAYGIGDYIILNSFLYKVKTAIEVGDPIDNTASGNVVKTTVGDEFKTFEFPVREMVKAQYDALPEATKNDGTMYMIPDDNGGWEAENSIYDNVASGLIADNVQDALDEVVNNLENKPKISTATTTSGGDGACTCYWIVKEYPNSYVELFGHFTVSKKSYAAYSTMFWAYYVDVKTPITLNAGSTRTVANWKIGNGFSVPSGIAGDGSTTIRVSALSSENGSSTAKTCDGYLHISSYKKLS